MALVGPSHPHPSVPAAGAILPTVATVLLRYGVSELDAMLSVGHPSWVPSVRPPSLSWGFLPDSGFSRPEPGSWLCLVLTSQSQVTCQSSSLTLCPLFCRRGGSDGLSSLGCDNENSISMWSSPGTKDRASCALLPLPCAQPLSCRAGHLCPASWSSLG